MQVVGCLTLYLIFLHGIKMKKKIHFALGSRRENMLSDTDAACVAFALTLRLEKGEEPTLDQREVQKKTTTHT